MAETMLSLILAGCNEGSIIDFVYRHVIDCQEFCMDTREIRRMLGNEVSLGEPDILMWIKDFINEGMENLRGGV
jgi:hypothetical protein